MKKLNFLLVAVVALSSLTASARSMRRYDDLINCYISNGPGARPIQGYVVKIQRDNMKQTKIAMMYPQCMTCMVQPVRTQITLDQVHGMRRYIRGANGLSIVIGLESLLHTTKYPAKIRFQNGRRARSATCTFEEVAVDFDV